MRMRITLDLEGPPGSLDELIDDFSVNAPRDGFEARRRLETWVRNQVVISLTQSGIRGWHIVRSWHEPGLELETVR